MGKKNCNKTQKEIELDRIYSKNYRQRHRDKIKEYDKTKRPKHISRKNNMDRLRIEKGGKCCMCGYDKEFRILHFHHLRDKSFNISDYNKSYEEMKKEAEKCILVCPNCHAILTFKY